MSVVSYDSHPESLTRDYNQTRHTPCVKKHQACENLTVSWGDFKEEAFASKTGKYEKLVLEGQENRLKASLSDFSPTHALLHATLVRLSKVQNQSINPRFHNAPII